MSKAVLVCLMLMMALAGAEDESCNAARATVRVITGKSNSHEKGAEYARQWANTFDSVISIQMMHDPSEQTELKFKYTVFGVWANGSPTERTPDGAPLVKGTEYIAECPTENGSIVYYRNTPKDIQQLNKLFATEGTAAHIISAMTSGTCTNKPQSEGGGCKSHACSSSCSYCEPGHYCCC